MAISVECAVEEGMDGRKTGCVVMTITRQQAGKLRNIDSIPGIGKGVLSTPKRPDRLYCPLSCLRSGRSRSSCCSKKAELNPICHLLALLGAHHILHVSSISVNLVKTRQLFENIVVHIVHRLRTKCFKGKTKYGMKFLCWHKQDYLLTYLLTYSMKQSPP
jgi:hypothetical protein